MCVCLSESIKVLLPLSLFFIFSSRRRHTRYWRDWSSDVCSSDLLALCSGLLDTVAVDVDVAMVVAIQPCPDSSWTASRSIPGHEALGHSSAAARTG